MAHRVRILAAACAVSLVSCGGGEDEAAETPQAATRRVALAAPYDTALATQLLDYAERGYPQYFPGSQKNQIAGGLTYRYYPATGAFLIVDDAGQVYAMGGAFGPRLASLGVLGDFLRPLAGTISGLTASGLVLANGAATYAVPVGAANFSFSAWLPVGTAYNLSVKSQPAGLSCSISNAQGAAGPAAATPAVVCGVGGDPLAPTEAVKTTEAADLFAVDSSGLGQVDTSGGGGDSGDGGVGGAAGDGAPMARARVTLTDANGRTASGLTDGNGRFLLRFPTALFKPPYILRVIDGGGAIRTAAITDAVPGNMTVWANVNSLTDKVVSDALNPAVNGTDKAFDGSRIDTAKVAKAKSDMVAAVKSALAAAGITNTSRLDPVRSRFAYDGTGVDAILDSVSHTREPATGATQLRTKLATISNDASGTEQPRLVTITAPLSTALVSLPSSEALTHIKLKRWTDEVNRCLALPAHMYGADAACVDTDGSRLVRTDYRDNGKDFREDFRTLFSEFDGSPVAGSSLRSPKILFVSRSAGSAVDDLAHVQFTVVQPYVGPRGPNGPVPGAVEYPIVKVFKRDDGLARALAGNWRLYGNRRVYDLAVEPRYYRLIQANPARLSTFPSYVHSSLRLVVLRNRWDRDRQAYVDANIRAVRVKGPGLPAVGIVLAPSVACGTSTYLALLNKVGSVPTNDQYASIVQNDFRLASVSLDGIRFPTPGGYFPTRDITVNQIPYLADFSPIRAYSLYTYEIFLRSNPGNAVPDAVETARILAPLMPPEAALKLPMTDVTPSVPLISQGAAAIPAGLAGVANWLNNPLAAPVSTASLYAEELNPARPNDPTKFYLIRSVVPGAYAARSVPSSQLLIVPTESTDSNCSSGRVPAYDGNTGVYREVTLSSYQGHARVFSSMAWNR